MKKNISMLTKATMTIVVSAACISSSLIIPCYPYIISTFRLLPADISFLVSVFLFGYLLGQIVYSPVIQKLGYKKTLISGFLILILSNIFQLISIKLHLFQLFIVARFFCALGSASGLVCIFSYAADIAVESIALKRLVSMLFVSLTLAAYFSITVSGLIISFVGNYAIFILLQILSVIQIILIYIFIGDKKTSKKKTSKVYLKAYLLHFCNMKLVLASLIASFSTIVTYLFNATGAILAIKAFHLSPKELGLFCLFNLMGVLVGSNFYSIFLKNKKSLRILGLALCICLLSILILTFNQAHIFSHDSPFSFFITLGILNIGTGIIYPCASFVALYSSKCSPSASSVLSFFKIFCPALAIYIISKLDLNIINGFIYPICGAYIATIIFYVLLIFKQRNEKQL